MKKTIASLFVLLTLSAANAVSAQTYQPDWDSLAGHTPAPKWFRDAKFGIYFHWGPYSVPAFGNEHYPRTMYGHPSGQKPRLEDNIGKFNPAIGFQSFREYEFHVENFGEPKGFEYHDLVPLFTAENFDAEEWAELFEKAGARFAGPVAEHHDGYAMWDSEWTPWNAADTGPLRDVTGELAEAIRARGMKLVTTFHHARVGRAPEGSSENDQRRWHYYGREKYFERVVPGHADSPELQKMYGTMPWEDFLAMWNGKLEEVIDTYRPDLIWFDSWLDRIPEENRQRFAAYYLNAAERWGKDVVITYKQQDLPQSVGVVDFEKGRLDELTDFAWLTDDTIAAGPWVSSGSWSYTEELDIKPARDLVHTLIDIVSKNGNLLLNISPRADGTIPDDQRTSLLGVGEWLRINGEAIYGTRPFTVFGEGPKRMEGSGHFVQMSGAYDAQNIRFTTRGDTVYAIQMGWPGAGKDITIRSLGSGAMAGRAVTGVTLLGIDERLAWEQTEESLIVRAPQAAPGTIALAYRIETRPLTRVGERVGWPDPEIGRGALDEKEAAEYAAMKHLFKRPHFNQPTPEFKAQWEKLASYPIPDWMLDGKFGIYTHWGPSTVPEYAGAGNYIANMYNPKGKKGIYQHHVETYGGMVEEGYTDLIDMFTAPEYDPKEYVDLMIEAGATFGGLGLVHHDGYLMWESEVSRWNAMDTGPHRDLFGEFVAEARKTDLKVMGSFHHARSYNYTHKNIDESLLTAEQLEKTDVFQDEYVDFFFPADTYPAAQFAQEWHDKIVEVSDKYQPDFIWFDGVQMQNEHSPEALALSALSHYYETSAARGQDVTVCSKLPAGDVVTQTAWFNYPEGVGIRGYENGRDMPADNGGYWLWDRAIAYPWGYVKGKQYKQDANYHIDSLVDIAARGGVFLLSLTPRASGAIPEEEKEILRGMGAWLKINGEAIYGTRRWHIPGEDHNDVTTWGLNENLKRITWKYNKVGAAQIRFTQAKDGTLYAIVLGRPEGGEVRIRNLREGSPFRERPIGRVELLGHDGTLSFSRDDTALVIDFPTVAAESHAYAFRIE